MILKIFRLIFFLSILFFNLDFQKISAQDKSSPETQKALNLDNCINIAIAQNPNIRISMEEINAARAKVGQAKSFSLPAFTFISSFTRTRSPQGSPITSTIGGNTFTIQSAPRYLSTVNDQLLLSKIIFDGGKIRAQINQAESNLSASIYNLKAEQNNLIFNVSQAYYNLLLAERLIKTAEMGLIQAEEHLKIAQKNFKIGISAKADVIFTEVPAATAKLNLAKAKQSKNLAEANLNRLMGLDINTKLLIEDELVYIDTNFEPEILQEEALKNRPELSKFQAQIDSFKSALIISKSGNLPNLSTSANLGVTGYDNIIIPEYKGWSLNLNLSFPFYNGNLTNYQIKEAEANFKKAQNILEQTKLDILLQVKQAYLNFITAKENISTAKAQLAKANENLRMSEGQYKTGVSPIINVIDAQVLQNQALLDENNALYSYKLAIAQIKQAIGK
ncbi:MAG: TolC family protein [Armatimonadetes bacterium]|nr:TolC family protein [Armatimonadota bacterium]